MKKLIKGLRKKAKFLPIALGVLAGILSFIPANDALSNDDETYCGICVTPQGNYPYQDDASSYVGTCGDC